VLVRTDKTRQLVAQLVELKQLAEIGPVVKIPVLGGWYVPTCGSSKLQIFAASTNKPAAPSC